MLWSRVDIYVQQLWRYPVKSMAGEALECAELRMPRGPRTTTSRSPATPFHPDTLVQDVDVLRDINARFDGKLALNAAVDQPGTIALGDAVQLLPA